MEVYGVICLFIILGLYIWITYELKNSDKIKEKEREREAKAWTRTIRQEKYLTKPLDESVIFYARKFGLDPYAVLMQWREENGYTKNGKLKTEEDIAKETDEKQKVDSGFYEEMHRF